MKDGFLNINKIANMTSHDVVYRVRKILNTKKVGHAGTLDPFAVGVLPVAVGRATKFLEYLGDCDKSYRAEIFFGVETDTGDITGNILNQSSSLDLPDRDDFKNILQNFIGIIEQTPPKFSAVKINGRKAYELARKNIDFTIPSRKITIYDIKILNLEKNILTIDIDCSKGTYIRSLAVDIGKKIKIPATLKALQRTRAGNFFIADSTDFENLNLIPVDQCLNHLPKLDLPPHRQSAFQNGLSSRINFIEDENKIFRVYSENIFIGTGKIIDGEIKPIKIFLRED